MNNSKLKPVLYETYEINQIHNINVTIELVSAQKDAILSELASQKVRSSHNNVLKHGH